MSTLHIAIVPTESKNPLSDGRLRSGQLVLSWTHRSMLTTTVDHRLGPGLHILFSFAIATSDRCVDLVVTSRDYRRRYHTARSHTCAETGRR